MTAPFAPGDRVLREVVIDRDPGGDDLLVKSSSVNGSWTAWVSRESIIALPTQSAQLRAAADVYDNRRGRPTTISACLRTMAAEIEAASAPKPEPTLREAAEKISQLYDDSLRPAGWSDQRCDEVAAAWRDLDAVLAREVAQS